MSWWHSWLPNAPSILATLTIGSLLYKFLIEKPMKAFIESTVIKATKPIQPNANGGKSLPDVAVTVTRIETKVDNVTSWLTKVDERLITHLSEHGKDH